jgi:hypothetical protein
MFYSRVAQARRSGVQPLKFVQERGIIGGEPFKRRKRRCSWALRQNFKQPAERMRASVLLVQHRNRFMHPFWIVRKRKQINPPHQFSTASGDGNPAKEHQPRRYPSAGRKDRG